MSIELNFDGFFEQVSRKPANSESVSDNTAFGLAHEVFAIAQGDGAIEDIANLIAQRLANWADKRVCDALAETRARNAVEVHHLSAGLAAAEEERDGLRLLLSPLSEDRVGSLFRARTKMPVAGESDQWYWYAWGVEDCECAHGIRNPAPTNFDEELEAQIKA